MLKILFFCFFSSLGFSSVSSSIQKQEMKQLVKIIKSDSFPEKKRWEAGMKLVQFTGKKSLPFMKKLLTHPHWLLRVMSLKSIRMLNAKENLLLVERRLFDKSQLVRIEALETLKAWRSLSSGKKVWRMLFDKKNYLIHKNKKKINKEIAARVIETLADIQYQPVKSSLEKIVRKKEFTPVRAEVLRAIDAL